MSLDPTKILDDQTLGVYPCSSNRASLPKEFGNIFTYVNSQGLTLQKPLDSELYITQARDNEPISVLFYYQPTSTCGYLPANEYYFSVGNYWTLHLPPHTEIYLRGNLQQMVNVGTNEWAQIKEETYSKKNTSDQYELMVFYTNSNVNYYRIKEFKFWALDYDTGERISKHPSTSTNTTTSTAASNDPIGGIMQFIATYSMQIALMLFFFYLIKKVTEFV